MTVTKKQIEMWPIERLIPYEKNAKKHSPEQIKKIANLMREVGFGHNHAIAVDKNGVIINGHGRRLAAIEVGLKEVPVLVCDHLTEEQVRAYRLADNRVAESEYDTELMAAELSELIELGVDMGEFFDERELEFAIEDLGEIDMAAITDDISAEVDSHSKSTNEAVEQESSQEVPLVKVLGFSKVTPSQQRALKLFLTLAETETGQRGPAALESYIRDYIGAAA